MSDTKGQSTSKHPQPSATAVATRDFASGSNKENAKPKHASGTSGGKATAQQPRPTTPPKQSGSKTQMMKNKAGDSPDSQVIESGDCSPRSEGVKRADRKDVKHWPGAQE
ncbi:MAG: hypothetical protein Q9164_003285 [Protoblastenia rupestris]